MHTLQHFSEDSQAARDVPPAQISELLAQGKGTLWLDIAEMDDDEAHLLQSEFHFHPLALEDLTQPGQRPKVVEYEGYVFVVAHEWQATADRDDLTQPCVQRSAELHLFAGRNYVVSVYSGTSEALKTAHRRWERASDLRSQGPYFLLYLILDSLVDDYYPALDAYDERIDTLEQMVLKPVGEQEVLFKKGGAADANPEKPLSVLLGLRRDLLEMRRYVAPLRDAVNVLLRHVEGVQDDNRVEEKRRTRARALFAYYQDIYDHTIRVVDTIDTYRDLLSGTLDAHLAVASNRLNEVVKVLTSVSIILMTIAGVSGIYGMNFTNMPELHWRHGYPYALGLMGGLSALEWLYFKRRNWL